LLNRTAVGYAAPGCANPTRRSGARPSTNRSVASSTTNVVLDWNVLMIFPLMAFLV
jgi:hypothetical protein